MSVTISGSGQIVKQVIQTVVNTTQAFSFGSYPSPQQVTGLSVTITPTNSANRILVMLDMKGGANTGCQISGILYRGASPIYTGAVSGSSGLVSTGAVYTGNNVNLGQLSAIYLDSPATTSAVTYNVYVIGDGNSQTVYTNREGRDQVSSDPRTTSSITVMEIAYA